MKKLISVAVIVCMLVSCVFIVPASAASQVVAEVKKINGVPRLVIDGDTTTGNLFFVNGDIYYSSKDIYTSQIVYASAGGIHNYSTIYNIDYNANLNTAAHGRYVHLRNILDNILDADKDAKILLRVSTVALAEWLGEEATADSDTGWVTMASDKWEEETVKRIKDMVAYILSVPRYAASVYGYHLDCGEWFPRGFTVKPDTCATNSAKFREWLKKKYVFDTLLQNAWGSTQYTLKNATVPEDLPINSDPSRSLLLGKTGQRFIDYNRYWSELTAARIEAFGKAIKEASGNKSVVIAFYGYYFEQYHASTGHWALQKLLESPYVDGFASPTSYSDRGAGASSVLASSAYMSVADTIARAGKLWLMESDQRTYINKSDREQDVTSYPPLKSIWEIAMVHRREMGISMVHSTAMYPMDLGGYGWYDDAEIWNNFGLLDTASLAYKDSQSSQSTFEVAVVVDEAASAAVGSAWNLSSSAFSGTLSNMYRAGVSFGLFELDDVLNGEADDCKLYIFVNPHLLNSTDVTKLCDKLHKNGKTAVYMYSFGDLSSADMKKLTGMSMTTVNTNISHALSVITPSNISGISSVNGCTGNPKTYCTSYTNPLAKFSDGTVGMALYEGDGYNSVFYGSNQLSIDNIRALAKYAGANVFVEGSDSLVANQDMLVLSARSQGNKTVSFSKSVDVYDYFNNVWYEDVTSFNAVGMAAGETRWFFYGEREKIEQKALPVWPYAEDQVKITRLDALSNDTYGITELLITLDSEFTQSYEAINSTIASPTPPQSLVDTVNYRILINGVSAADYKTAVWGYLGESEGCQQFSIRVYDDNGVRLCKSDFTLEIVAGAVDADGNRIEPVKYQYDYETNSFSVSGNKPKAVEVTDISFVYHEQFALTELILRLDSLYSTSMSDFQSKEHATGTPTQAQLDTASKFLLIDGRSFERIMNGFEWYNAVRIFLGGYGSSQIFDIYMYDAAFGGKRMYDTEFTFEIVDGAVDGDSNPLAPKKYCYSPNEKKMYEIESAYGLSYLRRHILKDTTNKTLDMNSDSCVDIRDLVRLKKSMSRQ